MSAPNPPPRRGMRAALPSLGLAAACALAPVAASAEPVRIYAAGSLLAAMKAVIAAAGLAEGAVAAPVFGPAGLLRQRLPPALAVPATYGMALMSDNPDAMRLALFLVSETGRTILGRHELGTIGEP